MTDFVSESLLAQVCELAQKAGDAILDVVRQGDLDVTAKADDSPVTRADLAANSIIVNGLAQITPKIVIVSEESLKLDETATAKRLQAEYIWLVDPLDGTKEFINGSPDYTVNIALIHNHVPILGVVYVPALRRTYAAVQGGSAWKRDDGNDKTALQTQKVGDVLRAVISRSHNGEETEQWLELLGKHERTSVGSSLKFCIIAEGNADVYPRFGTTMEWDTAAADAILRVAGGTVVRADDRTPLPYNKPDLHQPYFIAASSRRLLASLPILPVQAQ